MSKFIEDTDIIYATQEFPGDKVDWLNVLSWYDGPLEGLIKIDNKKYYAYAIELNDDDRTWTYCVCELTPERLAYEEYWTWLKEICSYEGRSGTQNHLLSGYPSPATKFYYARERKDYKEINFVDHQKHGTLIGWFKQ